MEVIQLERSAVCRQEKLKYLAFETKRNFLETQQLCRTLSGDIAVTTGPESVQGIQESLDNIGGTLVGLGLDFTFTFTNNYNREEFIFILEKVRIIPYLDIKSVLRPSFDVFRTFYR